MPHWLFPTAFSLSQTQAAHKNALFASQDRFRQIRQLLGDPAIEDASSA